jgi:NDP-sugar pyrophosphorylase family protein
MLSAQTIQDQHSGVAALVGENSARTAAICNLPHEASAESLVFATDPEQLAQARLRNPNGRRRKISHLGNVKIGDAVEIGSNCAVDRATLSSTYIRSGTKLDNFCHIAHNCDLGENGVFTAGFMMGGSTKIGRQFVTGGASVVTAHVTHLPRKARESSDA